MQVLHGLLGIAFFCAVAWALSSHRRRMPWRVMAFGIGLQFLLAWLILYTSPGQALFDEAAGFVTKLVTMTAPGAEMVFGPLAKPELMGEVFGPEHGFVFAFAGSGLIVIIFFSAFMSVLYHLGVMQWVVYLLGRAMSALMGISGAESMAGAANMFVGQTEAPLVVKPYIPGMTLSELNAMMTGGFATIAGSVLAVYIGFIGEEYGPHLLTASIMSAPAAFVIAKIMQPETEESTTAGKVELRIERTATNVVEAAANGTQDGLKLWLNVIAMLIAFIALVNLLNWPLGSLGHLFGMGVPIDAAGNPVADASLAVGMTPELSLNWIFGKVFAPFAWFMGVEGWHDCQLFGSLLGTKIAVNEFVAFGDMIQALPGSGAEKVFEHERSAKMAAYALCGFANFGSVGIQIGGISPLAPERKGDLSRLAVRAMLGGAFASWMTATIAGMFL